MVKISGFIISLILISLGAGVFAIYMTGINSVYPQTQYDNSSLAVFNKLSELQNTSERIKLETETAKQPTGVIDVIGAYFNSAYQALKISTASFDLFWTMFDAAAGKLGISGIALFKVALGSIVIILVFIGVIIKALVKSDV